MMTNITSNIDKPFLVYGSLIGSFVAIACGYAFGLTSAPSSFFYSTGATRIFQEIKNNSSINTWQKIKQLSFLIFLSFSGWFSIFFINNFITKKIVVLPSLLLFLIGFLFFYFGIKRFQKEKKNNIPNSFITNFFMISGWAFISSSIAILSFRIFSTFSYLWKK